MGESKELQQQKHILAIKYKYEGKKYKEIRQIIKNITGETVTEQTLAVWFMTGGKLYDSYCDFLEKQNNSLIKKAKQELRGLASTAVKVVKDTMNEFISVKIKCPNCKKEFKEKIKIPTRDKLTASKEVLDRALGVMENKPTNTYIHNELNINQIDERIREAEKQIEAIEGSTIKEDGGGDREETGV